VLLMRAAVPELCLRSACAHQLDVVEGWAAQDAHSILAHHVLARQHLQQRGLACDKQRAGGAKGV
jgi:hypothetical protein